MSRRELYQKLNINQVTPKDEVSMLSELVDYAQTENISIKNVLIHQQHLKRLFIKLLGIGLITGIFAAMAVVVTIQRFGLTEKINGSSESPLQKRVGENQTEIRFLNSNKSSVFKI